MKDIMKEVEAHYNAAVEYMGCRDAVLGVFAFGSMNYGLFDPIKSDVDTKAIIVPTYEHCLWDKPRSKEIKIDNAHCEIKDIRLMAKMYLKQNINFVETLFTKYYKINPMYIDIWETRFYNNREKIGRYNEYACIKSVTEQASNTFNRMKDGSYDSKSFSKILYLLDFLSKYINYHSYEECLDAAENADFFKRIKWGKEMLSLAQFDEIQKKISYFKNNDHIKAFKQVPDYLIEDEIKKGAESVILRRFFSI